jgi:hypothetical protein
MSATTAMNFQGSCIFATDGGGGQANITVGSKWLIASHSFAYTETISSDNFWYGDSRCGWDSCSYDVAYDVGRQGNDPTLGAQYVNCGIPNPYYLGIGDRIEVCGIVYCSGATESNEININLNYFLCSEINDASFNTTNLATSTTLFGNDHTSCFSLGCTVDVNINPCDVLFLLGFNVSDLGDDADVKISYTFKAYTNCVS